MELVVTGSAELTGVGYESTAAVVAGVTRSSEVVATSPASVLVATGSAASDVATGSEAGVEDDTTVFAVEEATIVGIVLPLGVAAADSLVSSARIQPVFLVIAAGQVTCVKETVGLSLPSNQSNRQ
jgi:hypothetical protein